MLRWIHDYPYWTFFLGLPVWWFVLSLTETVRREGRTPQEIKRRERRTLSYQINSILRKFNFFLNRIYGGWLQQKLSVPGYSPIIFLLTVYVVMILVLGPTISVSFDLWTLASCLVALALAGPFAQAGLLYPASVVAVILAAVAMWFLAGADATEAGRQPYRHVFLVAVHWIALLTVLACGLAQWFVIGFKRKYQTAWAMAPQLMGVVDLHVIPVQPTFTWWRLALSGLDSPLRNFLMFLFPVAVTVLLVPLEYMQLAAVVMAWVMWSVWTLAGIHERLANILGWVEQTFFRGVHFLASMLVILLALGRWLDFSYVATILNSTTASTITWFLLAAYASLWFYEYWAGYLLCERLLALLDPDPAVTHRNRVPYQIGKAFITTAIEQDDRFVQIHGTRLAAVGKYPSAGGKLRDGWELYDRLGLFATLVQKALRDPNVAAQVQRALGTTQQVNEDDFGLSDLRQRISVYYALLDSLLVGVLGFAVWLGHQEPPVAEATAQKAAAGTFALRQRMFEGTDGVRPKRVLFVSVSGGGTRAALYATSLFEGLAELNALPDVALYSGVSGGSAAIADLLLHYDQLKRPYDPRTGTEADAWHRRAEVMSSPFIDDVLRGTLEVRLSKGTRIGTLLAESFARRLNDAGAAAVQDRLGSFPHVGFILNTTLAATEPWDTAEGNWLPGDPTVAGARLILTNLKGDHIFPEVGFPGAESEYLKYVVVRDSAVPVTTGAALSANFPPVFSNSALVLRDGGQEAERHWVTDGGASDNRGAISMLYAVQHALQEQLKAKTKQDPPELHVVVSDASGLSLDFQQDRGIGSAFGAAEKYGNELMVELLDRIRDLYVKLDGMDKNLHVYFLPMPSALRARGGVGTHWMLPAYVTLAHPLHPEETLTLTGTLTRRLVMDLHHKDGKLGSITGLSASDQEKMKQAWGWVAGEDLPERDAAHRKAWTELVKNLQ